METNLPTKKRGNPNWTKKTDQSPKTESIPTEGLATVLTSPEAASLEDISLNFDAQLVMANESIYETAARINKKHPDKYMAFPYKEEALQAGKGWQLLKINPAKGDVEVVKDTDSATKTQWCILAWRDKRIQDYVESENNKRLRRANDLAMDKSNKEHVRGLHESLQNINPDLGAKPLGIQDS